MSTTQFRGPTDTAYPPGAATSVRPDLDDDEAPPGSSLEQVVRSVLDPWQSEIADPDVPLRGRERAQSRRRGRARGRRQRLADRGVARPGAAAARLDCRAQRDPALAAREIDRVGGHPRFVQVSCRCARRCPTATATTGRSSRRPTRTIWRSALHFGGAPGNPPTSSGWPSYYIEEYVGHGQRLPVAADQPDRRRRVRSLPDLRDGPDRERVRPGCPRCCGGSTRMWRDCAARCPGYAARPRTTSASTSASRSSRWMRPTRPGSVRWSARADRDRTSC